MIRNWLPAYDSELTKFKRSVTELISYYYLINKRRKNLCFGDKPAFIAENEIPSQRRYNSLLKQANWKNPILEGQKYLDYLNQMSEAKYIDVAEHFNVSKARVSQMIGLVNNLPEEITDYFTGKKEVSYVQLTFFTERKLRPLTVMKFDQEKIKKFYEFLNFDKETSALVF